MWVYATEALPFYRLLMLPIWARILWAPHGLWDAHKILGACRRACFYVADMGRAYQNN